ncbi:MAG: serine/threonine-protein kinase, partial [Planctomycetota bacterium]
MTRRFGSWILLERLGSGGMGEVFKARSAESGRIIALKLLRADLSKDPEFVERFQREARAGSLLRHPRIVEGIDVGEAGGRFYFAMEFVEGETLAAIIKRDGRIEPARALAIAAQMAEALDAAERSGILHRDVKPANILVSAAGDAKLADLGLAKHAVERDPETAGGDRGLSRLDLDPGETLTRMGSVVGTPYYMSPEQALGEDDLDIRSDIYALGATLAHALTGQSFFHGSDMLHVIAQVSAGKFPKFSEQAHDLPANIVALVGKMTAPDRRFRPPTAAALLEDIRRVQRGEDPSPADDPDAEPLSAIMESPPRRQTLPRLVPRARSSAGHSAVRRPAPSRRGPLMVAAVVLAAAGAILLATRTPPPKPTDPVVQPLQPAAGADGKDKGRKEAGEKEKAKEKGEETEEDEETEPAVVDVAKKDPGESDEETRKKAAEADAKRKAKAAEDEKKALAAEDEKRKALAAAEEDRKKKARTEAEEEKKRKEKAAAEAAEAKKKEDEIAKKKAADEAFEKDFKPLIAAIGKGDLVSADRNLRFLEKQFAADEPRLKRLRELRDRLVAAIVENLRKNSANDALWNTWVPILADRYADTEAYRGIKAEFEARKLASAKPMIFTIQDGTGAIEAEDALAGSPKVGASWRLDSSRPGSQGAGCLVPKPGAGPPESLRFA